MARNAQRSVIVGIDTGGTFTDLVAVVDGRLQVHKVLSTPTITDLCAFRATPMKLATVFKDGRFGGARKRAWRCVFDRIAAEIHGRGSTFRSSARRAPANQQHGDPNHGGGDRREVRFAAPAAVSSG